MLNHQTSQGLLNWVCGVAVWLLHWSVDGWLITVPQPVPLTGKLICGLRSVMAWKTGSVGNAFDRGFLCPRLIVAALITARPAALASCDCVWFLASRLANFNVCFLLAGFNLTAFSARTGCLAGSVSVSLLPALPGPCFVPFHAGRLGPSISYLSQVVVVSASLCLAAQPGLG